MQMWTLTNFDKSFPVLQTKVTLKVNETNSFDSRKGKDMQIEKNF